MKIKAGKRQKYIKQGKNKKEEIDDEQKINLKREKKAKKVKKIEKQNTDGIHDRCQKIRGDLCVHSPTKEIKGLQPHTRY